MTDEIDLDEMDLDSDEETGNRGDWFWREEGDPEAEPNEDWLSSASRAAESSDSEGRDSTAGGSDAADTGESSGQTAGGSAEPAPHVPRENRDKPVGIPIEQGGAGGTPAGAEGRSTGDSGETAGAEDESAGRPDETAVATGEAPHGGDADEMTMALTYEAATRLANPAAALSDAANWADWTGIVGDVEAHVINAFQRDHRVDVDFFNGSGRGPAERLADVDAHSMFYAERMVVVGVGDDERLAREAGWEFVPLSEAAEKADWELLE